MSGRPWRAALVIVGGIFGSCAFSNPHSCLHAMGFQSSHLGVRQTGRYVERSRFQTASGCFALQPSSSMRAGYWNRLRDCGGASARQIHRARGDGQRLYSLGRGGKETPSGGLAHRGAPLMSKRGEGHKLAAAGGDDGEVSTQTESGRAGGSEQAVEARPGNAESRRRAKKRFRGLGADRFQHPFDQEATAVLRRLPGLEFVIRSVVPPLEDAVYIDNISNSILVGPKQMTSLHTLLVEACSVLDMQVPDMYIRQNPVPNAYTLAIRGKKPFIVLHSSLVDLMEPEEVQAVIGHELGHLKCEHGIWVTLATVLANGLYRGGLLGSLLADSLGLRRRLMQWSRAAEFTCDRAAMLVAQDVNVVVSTLLKLAGGSVTQASELSVPEFLKQASAYELASKTRIGQILRSSQSRERTHPLPVIRARELVKFSESPQYLSIFNRGVPLS